MWKLYSKSMLASLLVSFAMSANAINHNALVTYAQSLKGLKGPALKTAMSKIMNNNLKTLPYNGKTKGTWWGFYLTDRNPANSQVYNYYSDSKFYFTGQTSRAISGMNTEHSFAKSWWGKTENNAYRDLFNLYPSESQANNYKSNYCMGVVTTVRHASGEGFDKVGTGTVEGRTINLWEPGNRYKGLFSRSYMYMVTTYQDLSWTSEGANMLTTGTYPTLKKWASDLFLRWSKEHKVNQREIDRNNAIYKIQRNRNLFVDYPNLCEYIWGDSVDYAFDPNTSLSTATDDHRYPVGDIKEMFPDQETGPVNPSEEEPEATSMTFVKITTAPVAGKKYLIVANNNGKLNAFKAIQLTGTKKYDYAKGWLVTETEGKIVTTEESIALTLEGSGSNYIIKDNLGQYYSVDGSHANFTPVTDVAKATEWTITPQADGTFKIVSVGKNTTIQFSSRFKTFGNYTPGKDTNIATMLYQLDETMGIGSVVAPSVRQDGVVYNLRGVRMPSGKQLPRGVYIKNGKKFVVR